MISGFFKKKIYFEIGYYRQENKCLITVSVLEYIPGNFYLVYIKIWKLIFSISYQN